MKKVLKNPLLIMAFMALGLSSCHNGDAPVADQEKKLDHLIFEEICYEGTYNEHDYKYSFDNYVKITNPTEKSVYLDGMGLAVSALDAANVVNLAEGTDVTATHFTASILLRFPGKSGEKNHELKAGASIFLAAIAHNHTEKPSDDSDFFDYNPYSYDLSDVDYQWQTKEEVENQYTFPVNETKPTLTKVFPIGDRAIPYSLAVNGYAIALINLPEGLTDEQILADTEDNPYIWYTSWSVLDTGGGHSHTGQELRYLKFPNDMVIDAVQICSQRTYKWSTIPGVDAGYASTQDMERSGKGYFLGSLFRKHDGLKFVDTNNSSEDFEVRPASIWLKYYKDPTKKDKETEKENQ